AFKISISTATLRNRNGNIVLCELEETAGVDVRIGNRLVGRDDNVVDFADALLLVVEDRRAEHLTFSAPAQSDIACLRFRNANEGRTRDLRPRNRRRDQNQARKN